MLRLLGSAGPDDVAVCLLSGGGSALLPAPAEGVTLDDKQAVTKLLHACGATIDEMNAVRKHLSRVKGGRLAEAFRGKLLVQPHHLRRGRRPARRDRLRPDRPRPDDVRRRPGRAGPLRLLDRVPRRRCVESPATPARRGELPETPKAAAAERPQPRHRQQRDAPWRARKRDGRAARATAC